MWWWWRPVRQAENAADFDPYPRALSRHRWSEAHPSTSRLTPAAACTLTVHNCTTQRRNSAHCTHTILTKRLYKTATYLWCQHKMPKHRQNSKGRHYGPFFLFFYKAYKGGVGVIPVYKNLCCEFCIFWRALAT